MWGKHRTDDFDFEVKSFSWDWCKEKNHRGSTTKKFYSLGNINVLTKFHGNYETACLMCAVLAAYILLLFLSFFDGLVKHFVTLSCERCYNK